MIWQTWWVWIVAGIGLGILETLAPGYIFLGFALGALAVGLMLLAGWGPGSLAVTLLVFALVSLAAWLVLRRVFPNSAGSVKVWNRDINED